MEHKRIETSQGTIGALTWPGQGETVVLVHGLFDSAYTWRSVAPHIPYPVIALDLPGFGMSQVPREGNVSLYAEAVSQALASEGIDEFHLVGHSFGGAVASEISEQQGERVLSLFLVAPAGYGTFRLVDFMASSPVQKGTAFLSRQITGSKMATDFAYNYFVTHGRRFDEETLASFARLNEERQVGIARAVGALSKYGRSKSPSENFYGGPSAYLWGTADRRIPKKHIEEVERVLPRIRGHVWPEAEHHPQHEDPAGFAILLENLVEESGRKRRR